MLACCRSHGQHCTAERRCTCCLPCQVMPNQPCRGVEVWESPRCGGEKAWDAALKAYTDATGNPKDYFKYVIAVNSMRKRTRQQVRAQEHCPQRCFC